MLSEVRDAASRQAAIHAHILRISDVRSVLFVLAERLRDFFPNTGEDDAIVALANLRVVYRSLPSYVGFATLRMITNSWLTSRRLAHAAGDCRFGCGAIGGDCALHYAVAAMGARVPTWLSEGTEVDAMAMRLGPERTICRDAVWRYLLDMLFTRAMAGASRWSGGDAAAELRAHMRSLATRAPHAAFLMERSAPGRRFAAAFFARSRCASAVLFSPPVVVVIGV